jgi:hypothetical protein
MAGMAALTVPSINKIAARAAHVQRVTTALKQIEKNRLESYEDGVVFINEIWYTPFQCEPHTIVVDNETISVNSWYGIKRKPND